MSHLNPALCLVAVAFFHSADAAEPDFARDVRPVLSDACYHCHGPDEDAREAGLRLDDRTAVLESGILDEALLDRLTTSDPDRRMPPPDSNRVIAEEDRERLVAWLDSGAKWPEDDRHWSFVPPRVPPTPKVETEGWAENPIDRFVFARMRANGLRPSPRADRVTLLRRVSLDLTGLPPTPAEIDRFLDDASDDAYEQAVDRLVESRGFQPTQCHVFAVPRRCD
ncbi:MAG: DUF1549 domain-containing protein, partial [Planctomycetota bacterium]